MPDGTRPVSAKSSIFTSRRFGSTRASAHDRLRCAALCTLSRARHRRAGSQAQDFPSIVLPPLRRST
eukprot:1298040-Prymnesium_polylepis.3